MTTPAASSSLGIFLDLLGLHLAAHDRVVEIDRELAVDLASENMDVERCASLVLEAADIEAGLQDVRAVLDALECSGRADA